MHKSWHGAQLNEAKIILADEATTLLHGAESVVRIRRAINSDPNQMAGTDEKNESIHLFKVTFLNSSESISLFSILHQSKLSSSKNEAKQFIKSGAVRINDVKCMDPFMSVNIQSQGREFVVSIGKRKFVRVQLDVIIGA